jgi:L-threonylcarbamoyladenylate synthase
LATGPDTGAALGIRVPQLDGALEALAAVPCAVLQSSANLAGGPDPHTLDGVPRTLREEADVTLDAGPLPGTPSTIVDLRAYEQDGRWRVVRAGAVDAAAVATALADPPSFRSRS